MPEIEVRQATDAELEALRAAAWMRAHTGSHVPFAAVADGEVVGMAWLAIQSRVPSPRGVERRSGDLQSCYVVPDARGHGVGTRLADAVLRAARDRGLEHVTVHASPRSVAVYERAGFRANPRSLWADGAIAERSG